MSYAINTHVLDLILTNKSVSYDGVFTLDSKQWQIIAVEDDNTIVWEVCSE